MGGRGDSPRRSRACMFSPTALFTAPRAPPSARRAAPRAAERAARGSGTVRGVRYRVTVFRTIRIAMPAMFSNSRKVDSDDQYTVTAHMCYTMHWTFAADLS